jgi:hypothetical protein
MDIIDLYKSVLQNAAMKADEHGFVSLHLADLAPSPVEIKGQRLVLPIREQLNQPDTGNRVFFHPLVEIPHRGESEVVEKLREHIGMNLNLSLCFVAISLLQLATSPAQHAMLSPDQAEYMTLIKEANDETIQRMVKLAEAMAQHDPRKSFVNLYVKRGAVVDGRKRMRAGIVSFPLYEELKKVPEPKAPNEVFGIKLRKVDREVLTNLLEYMIPGIDKPENFVSASDSTVAPYLDALMKAVAKVAININNMVDLFAKPLPEMEQLRFDLDWQDDFEDLTRMLPQIRGIPAQPGNEGKAIKTATNAVIPVPSQAEVHQAARAEVPPGLEYKAPAAAAPAPTPSLPAEVTGKPAVDHFGNPIGKPATGAITPPPAVQITPPPTPQTYPDPRTMAGYATAGGYPNQGGYYGQQQQPNPYQQQGPASVPLTASGKVSFRDALAQRPDLAAAVGFGTPGYGYGGGGRMEDEPRWAQPSYNRGYGGSRTDFSQI